MDALENLLLAVGRILLSSIFIISGFRKLGTVAATVAQMSSHGLPFANILVWGAIALELGGGLMLACGLATRWAALAFAVYTLVLALIFHAYWALPAAEARTQLNAFYEHLGMIGGMLYVAVFGGGGCSIDALLGRQTKRAALA
jgi:putative oxidoreductase